MEPYPATVAECIEPGRKYKPAVLRALREFARSKPWQGPLVERRKKLLRLHKELTDIYNLRTKLDLRYLDSRYANGGSGSSSYSWRENKITLQGHLSILTYLHEFGHALGKGEDGACRWSINLFARIFPRSFAKLTPSGHTLVRGEGE